MSGMTASTNGMESFWSIPCGHSTRPEAHGPLRASAWHNLREADTIDIMGAVANGGIKRLR